DFAQSERLLQEVGFATSYVFKYSPRPGTPAVRLEDDVPDDEKGRRCTRLVRLQEAISLEQNRRAIGTELEVLVDGASKKDELRLSGRSRDNRVVVFRATAEMRETLQGRLASVRIEDASPHSLYGMLVSPV